MTTNNIPVVKLGIIAVSRDCFPIKLSTQRRENIVKAYKGEIYDCPTTVENELDMLKVVDDVKANGCNALVVFLGNFGPETPETETLMDPLLTPSQVGSTLEKETAIGLTSVTSPVMSQEPVLYILKRIVPLTVLCGVRAVPSTVRG